LSANDATEVRSAFEEAGQAQVFRFWKRLNKKQRSLLISQANQIDLDELRRAVDQALQSSKSASESFANLEPAPWIPLPADAESEARWREAEEIGEELLHAGRVAAFTVAGGQGTRLGYDGPKGAFPIAPVSGKSLFQLFAEKLKAAGARYGRSMPWFVMTSEANHQATKDFFEKHSHFGLDSTKIRFLQQGMMPAVLETGQILLERPDRIAMNPDGHGGAFRVLAKSGAANEMQEMGIEIITYFQVDNPLAPFLEPASLGFHVSTRSDMTSRAAPKTGPDEKVGVFCLQNGSPAVIEYSDLPAELAQLRNNDGTLVFKAGNLAMHTIDPAFAERIGKGDKTFRLPFHAARKKVPTIDEKGESVFPDEPNAIKLETFIFDAIPLAEKSCVLEVAREEGFSPLKNAEGLDSIQTCQADQLRQYARWAKEAGAALETDNTGLPSLTFEISAEFALDKKEFKQRWGDAGSPLIREKQIFNEDTS